MGQNTSTTPKPLENMDADIQYGDKDGITINIPSAHRVEFVRTLIQHNLVNMYNLNHLDTFMDLAIQQFDLPMIKMLLEQKFDPNFIKHKRHPIEELCSGMWWFDDEEEKKKVAPILEMFLEAGADFTMIGYNKIPIGEVVLTWENGYFAKMPDVIQVLIKSGMNLDKFQDNPLIANYIQTRNEVINDALSTEQSSEPGLTKLTESYL